MKEELQEKLWSLCKATQKPSLTSMVSAAGHLVATRIVGTI